MKKKARKEAEPEFYKSALQTPVRNYNVYRMKPLENIAVSALLFVVGAIVGYVFYGNLFTVEGVATIATHVSNAVVMILVGVLAVVLLRPAWIAHRVTQQKKELRQQFRNFLEALVSSLSAGKNVSQAVQETYKDVSLQYGEKSFISNEIQEMIHSEQNGIHLEACLADLGRRSRIQDIADFGDVFAIGYEQGANMKEVARKTYGIIDDKMEIEEEIRTKLTSNQIQLRMMMGTPVLIIGMLRFTNESFANNFSTPSGVMSMTIGLCCMGIAYLLGKKITSIGEEES